MDTPLLNRNVSAIMSCGIEHRLHRLGRGNDSPSPMVLERTERIVNLTASVLGIVSFGYSLRYAGSLLPSSGLSGEMPALVVRAFPAKLVAIVLVHGVTAYGFASAIERLAKLGPGFGRVLVFVLCVIAAWTAIFNAQWLLTGPLPTRAVSTGAQIAGAVTVSVVVTIFLAITGWYFVFVKFGEIPPVGAFVPDYSRPTPSWSSIYALGPAQLRSPPTYEQRWDPEVGRATNLRFHRDRETTRILFITAYVLVTGAVIYTYFTT